MGSTRVSGWAAAGLVLLVAACGSSSPLPPARLAARVNAACATYVRASAAVPQPGDFATSATAATVYLQKLKPLVESEHTSIAGLTPTAAVRAQFDRFKAASDHQLRLFESALAKARHGGAAAIGDLSAAARYKRKVMVPLETELGFTSCVR